MMSRDLLVSKLSELKRKGMKPIFWFVRWKNSKLKESIFWDEIEVEWAYPEEDNLSVFLPDEWCVKNDYHGLTVFDIDDMSDSDSLESSLAFTKEEAIESLKSAFHKRIKEIDKEIVFLNLKKGQLHETLRILNNY